MVKLKANRDKVNLGVLVPGGQLRYFKKKGDILELTKEEAEDYTIEANLEGGIISLVGSKEAKSDKKDKDKKDAENKKAFSNKDYVNEEETKTPEGE